MLGLSPVAVQRGEEVLERKAVLDDASTPCGAGEMEAVVTAHLLAGDGGPALPAHNALLQRTQSSPHHHQPTASTASPTALGRVQHVATARSQPTDASGGQGSWAGAFVELLGVRLLFQNYLGGLGFLCLGLA